MGTCIIFLLLLLLLLLKSTLIAWGVAENSVSTHIYITFNLSVLFKRNMLGETWFLKRQLCSCLEWCRRRFAMPVVGHMKYIKAIRYLKIINRSLRSRRFSSQTIILRNNFRNSISA